MHRLQVTPALLLVFNNAALAFGKKSKKVVAKLKRVGSVPFP